jgi:hypothetical protein
MTANREGGITVSTLCIVSKVHQNTISRLDTHTGSGGVGQRPAGTSPVAIHAKHIAASQAGLSGKLSLERERVWVIIGDDLTGIGGSEPGLPHQHCPSQDPITSALTVLEQASHSR